MKLVGLTPDVLIPILASLAVIVGLLYILKTRRRRVTVPFSPIWAKVLTQKGSSSLWKKFKRVLSYLLQMVLVILVVLALGDPRPENENLVGRNIVLLVDTSASMTALDVSGAVDRLDLAKKEALKVVGSMGPADAAMLVTVDGQLKPRTPFIKEKTLLESEIREIKSTATVAELEQAISFIADATKDKPDTEVYIFSDGAFGKTKFGEVIKKLPASVKVKHVKAGEQGSNLAVTAFRIRRYLSNKLDYEYFVEVRNYFDRPVDADLQIYVDGSLSDSKRLRLPPQGVVSRFYPNEGLSGERLEARIVPRTADLKDVFALDDSAYAILPSSRLVKVALVMPDDNLFLEAPFVSNQNVEYDVYQPENWSPEIASNYDVVVLDRFVPAPLPETGNYLLFAPPEGSKAPWAVEGTVDRPLITNTTKKHPLLRWVSLGELNIAQGVKAKRTSQDDNVASSFGAPMILARTEENRRFVGVMFDVRGSDFPLRISMPVFILNALDYLLDEGDSIAPSYKTGDAWFIDVPADVETVTLTTPSGKQETLPAQEGKVVFYGSEVGFHQVDAGEQAFGLAANLADIEESAIKPPDTLEAEGREIQAGVGQLNFIHEEYWIYLVLGAMALMVIEWLSYNRRWTV